MVIECSDAATCQSIAETQREFVLVGVEIIVIAIITYFAIDWATADF